MRVAKITAEIGADIARFRAAVREAERELLSFTKLQEKLGQSAVNQNQKIAESEQKLVNVSHQLMSAERNLENARHAQIKQLLGIENTQRRLTEAQLKYNAVSNSEKASLESKTAALNRVKNLENNLITQRLQLSNSVNTLSKAESNLQRIQESSILQLRKHILLEEQEKRIALQTAEAKISAEKASQEAKNLSHNLTKKQLEQEALLRRKNEVEYTQWWERQIIRSEKELEQKERLLLKEKQLADAQTYQLSLMGRLSGAYSGLHRAQTFFSNSATSMTTMITLPFALLSKSAFDASVQMEAYRVTIENFVGSTEKANEELTKLKSLAEKPGLEFEGLMKAFPRMLAVGTSAEQARFILEQFGNELGRTKAKTDEIRRTFENLPQIMSMKSLVGQETLQMSRLMPSFRQGLLSLYGTSEGKELTVMGISGKKVIEDLAVLFSKTTRAANSTQNEVKNLTQEFFFLRAEVGDEFKKIFMELAPAIRDTMKEAVNWFKNLSPEIKKNIVQGGLFLAILGPISGALAGFIGVARAGIGVIIGLGNAYRFVAGGVAVAKGVLTVSDLATKFQTIGMASTAAAATSQAAWAVALLPLLKIVAVAGIVAIAAYGIKKAYDSLNPSIEEVSEKIYKQHSNTKILADQELKVASLVAQYGNLKESVNKAGISEEKAKSIKQKMFTILQEIYQLQPGYISKLDAEGNAIELNTGLLHDYNLVLAEKIRLQKDAMKQEAADNMQTAASTLEILRERRRNLDPQLQLLQQYSITANGNGSGMSRSMASLNEEWRSLKQSGKWTSGFNPLSVFSSDPKDFANYVSKNLKESTEEWKQLGEAIQKTKEKIASAKQTLTNLSKGISEKASQSVEDSKPSETSTKEISGFTEAQLEAMAKYINTPAGQNSCGYFASQMIEAMYGVDVPGKFGIGRAGNGNGLEDWLRARGATQITRKDAHPGDVMFMPGKGPSGVHVGIFDGRNMIDSSGIPSQFGDRSKISFDKGIPSSARFYRVPWEQKDGQQTVQGLRDQENIAEKLERLVASQKEKTAEIAAEMQNITPESKYQVMYAKMIADYQSEYGDIVPVRLEAAVRETVEMRKQADIWNKNLEVRKQIDDLHRQDRLSGVSERDKKIINAFGIDKWYDPQIDQSKKDKFQELFGRGFDRDHINSASKSLLDLGKQLKEFYDEANGKGFKTKSQETESQIESILKGISTSAQEADPWLQAMIAGVRKLSKEADSASLNKLLSEFDRPVDTQLNKLNQQLSGTFDARAYALQDFLFQNKEKISEATARANGVDQTGRFTSKFLQGYDAEKQAEKIFKYKEQMDGLNKTYQELTANSAFDIWLLRQKQWNDELKRFELPPELSDTKNARSLFDAEGRNNNQQRFNSLMAETTQRMAELAANSPFERWRVSLMQMDEAGNLQPLIADFKVLERMFADQQLMNLIEQFSEGMRDIFGDMIYDISENGFKGMFANIYSGFQKLLFKMSVEYLSSMLYQSMIGSLFKGFGLTSIFGGFGGVSGVSAAAGGAQEGIASFAIGGPVKENQIIQVGEHGKELFVPSSNGYIIPSHLINNYLAGNKVSGMVNSIGGSSSLSRYASDVHSVTNFGNSSSNVVNEGDNSSSQIVVINHNYYGSEGTGQRSGKTTSQQVTDAQRQVDRINQRIK